MTPLISITKLDWRRDVVTSWQGDLVAETADYILVRCPWKGRRPTVLAPGIVCAPGDVFHEYFWFHENYALWKLLDGESGAFKFWYCNISARPVISENTVVFQDLLLDIVIDAGGVLTVLDEDEFDYAVAAGLSPELAQIAHHGVEQVKEMVKRRAFPFA